MFSFSLLSNVNKCPMHWTVYKKILTKTLLLISYCQKEQSWSQTQIIFLNVRFVEGTFECLKLEQLICLLIKIWYMYIYMYIYHFVLLYTNTCESFLSFIHFYKYLPCSIPTSQAAWLWSRNLCFSLISKPHLSATSAAIVLRGAMQMTGKERPDLILRFILIKSDLLSPCHSLRGKLNVLFSKEMASSNSIR